jgi:Spy/CpxP family protein refolding chaperone
MKSNKTLVLAASMLALTLSAFPHQAAASSTTAPTAVSEISKPIGGKPVKYMLVALAADILLGALLP